MERETMARKKLARVSTPLIDIPNAPLAASTPAAQISAQAKGELLTEASRPPVIPAAAQSTPTDHMPALAAASSSHDLEHPAA